MPSNAIVAAGLDVGSAYVRCVITLLENSALRLLGWGEAPSLGWKRSRIRDWKQVSFSIREAVAQAERMSRLELNSAVVGVGGWSIHSGDSRSSIDLGHTRRVLRSDAERAIAKAANVHLPEDTMVYQIVPQHFVVDHNDTCANPVGRLGSRLEASVLVIFGSAQEHDALIGSVNAAHLSVEETVLEPVAAAFASIAPSERQQCIALLDIGSDSSGVVVYDGDAMVTARTVPIGADYFTRDVAERFRIRHPEAEEIKVRYGCAMLGHSGDHVVIGLPAETQESRDIPCYELNYTLQMRAEELFEHVQRELQRVGIDRYLTGGVVLTGGGSRLTGMLDLAANHLDGEARWGLTTAIDEWPPELENPSWTVAGGLAMYSARLKQRAISPPQARRPFSWLRP